MKTRQKLRRVLAITALSLLPFASARGTVWNGTSDSLFFTGGNWSLGVPGATDPAEFNNAGNGNTNISVTSPAAVGNLVFDSASAAAYTLGGSAITVSQTSGIVVNSNVVNSQIINNDVIWSLNATTLYNNSATATLHFNGTISKTSGSKTLFVGGTGDSVFSNTLLNSSNIFGLSKIQTGTVTLGGGSANTHTGTTTIAAGTLIAAKNGALGTTTAGTNVQNNATLGFQGGFNYTTAEAVNITGDGATGRKGAIDNISGNNAFSGAVTLTGPATIGSTLNRLVINGGINNSGHLLTLNPSGGTLLIQLAKITGAGGLNKTGNSSVTLNVAAGNDYTGPTTITEGTIVYGGGTSGDQLGSGALTVNGATAQLNMSTGKTDTVGTVTLDGDGKITSADGSSVLTSTGSFEMKSGTVTAILDGTGIVLNKTTSGTVTLSAANTYSGGTHVFAGNLIVNNASGSGLGTGNVIVHNGGTLSGSGAINATSHIGGELSPGNSVGTLAWGANQTWVDGGSLLFQIDDALGTAGATGGPGWDLNTVAGTLDLSSLTSSGFTIDIESLLPGGGTNPGAIANFNSTSSYIWPFLITGGGVLGFDADKFTLNSSAFAGVGNFSIQLGAGGNSLELHHTAVPEPGTLILLAGVLAGLGLRFKRRNIHHVKRYATSAC